MSPLTRWLCVALIGALTAAGSVGLASVSKAKPASSPEDASTPWEALELSSRLYQEGMARQDALLVAAAARLRTTHLWIEPDGQVPGWVSGSAMLRTAEKMAASDPGLRAIIAEAGEEAPRGGLNGPQVASVLIAGRGEARLTHAFKGGRPAYVYAEGALTSQLSIAVLNGRTPVCETRVEVGRALCRWMAARDGPVTTVVRNGSAEAATFLVVTN